MSSDMPRLNQGEGSSRLANVNGITQGLQSRYTLYRLHAKVTCFGRFFQIFLLYIFIFL